jgi:hypothetical protein
MHTQHTLTDHQIYEMARAAEIAYEFSASWRDAGRAAREYARDEYGIRASDTAVGMAVRVAQTMWDAAAQSARRAIEEAR